MGTLHTHAIKRQPRIHDDCTGKPPPAEPNESTFDQITPDNNEVGASLPYFTTGVRQMEYAFV